VLGPRRPGSPQLDPVRGAPQGLGSGVPKAAAAGAGSGAPAGDSSGRAVGPPPLVLRVPFGDTRAGAAASDRRAAAIHDTTDPCVAASRQPPSSHRVSFCDAPCASASASGWLPRAWLRAESKKSL
jgi:hypothetical protein